MTPSPLPLEIERLFPVIYWQSKDAKPGPMQIPWSVAEQAYSAYSSTYGRNQTLERLAERGGFHAGELDRFLPDWREQSSEITALRSKLREMAAEIAEAGSRHAGLCDTVAGALRNSGRHSLGEEITLASDLRPFVWELSYAEGTQRRRADEAVVRLAAVSAERDDFEKLFWLAARDVVFFGTYNEDTKDWDDGWHVAVSCNDTFYYASADAWSFKPKDVGKVKDVYDKWGLDGVVALCAVARKETPLKQLQTAKYHEAYAELAARAASEGNEGKGAQGG